MASGAQGFFQIGQGLPRDRVGARLLGDFLARVQHGGMVFAAKDFADLVEGEAGDHFFAEVHGELAGECDLALAAAAPEVGDAQIEMFGDGAQDVFGVDGLNFLAADEVAENFFGGMEGDGPFLQLAVGEQGDECAFELADVGGDAGGDVAQDFGRQGDILFGGLVLENGHAGFEVGHLDVGDQAPFEA